ncbi:basic proline-rich protein-like [Vulpes lagopus]|uniref:basic proline-rich protein-like n=1 Tax=Vulpes lagopus TaxID=494514 RepID=UPI001BC9E42C|nr:basic proline-rich protein-like [Vulpes lagopus]
MIGQKHQAEDLDSSSSKLLSNKPPRAPVPGWHSIDLGNSCFRRSDRKTQAEAKSGLSPPADKGAPPGLDSQPAAAPRGHHLDLPPAAFRPVLRLRVYFHPAGARSQNLIPATKPEAQTRREDRSARSPPPPSRRPRLAFEKTSGSPDPGRGVRGVEAGRGRTAAAGRPRCGPQAPPPAGARPSPEAPRPAAAGSRCPRIRSGTPPPPPWPRDPAGLPRPRRALPGRLPPLAPPPPPQPQPPPPTAAEPGPVHNKSCSPRGPSQGPQRDAGAPPRSRLPTPRSRQRTPERPDPRCSLSHDEQPSRVPARPPARPPKLLHPPQAPPAPPGEGSRENPPSAPLCSEPSPRSESRCLSQHSSPPVTPQAALTRGAELRAVPKALSLPGESGVRGPCSALRCAAPAKQPPNLRLQVTQAHPSASAHPRCARQAPATAHTAAWIPSSTCHRRPGLGGPGRGAPIRQPPRGPPPTLRLKVGRVSMPTCRLQPQDRASPPSWRRRLGAVPRRELYKVKSFPTRSAGSRLPEPTPPPPAPGSGSCAPGGALQPVHRAAR